MFSSSRLLLISEDGTVSQALALHRTRSHISFCLSVGARVVLSRAHFALMSISLLAGVHLEPIQTESFGESTLIALWIWPWMRNDIVLWMTSSWWSNYQSIIAFIGSQLCANVLCSRGSTTLHFINIFTSLYQDVWPGVCMYSHSSKQFIHSGGKQGHLELGFTQSTLQVCCHCRLRYINAAQSLLPITGQITI